MQNKGFVKFIGVLLTLICIFYMSFSFVVSHYDDKIHTMAQTEAAKVGCKDSADWIKSKEKSLSDSINNEEVYMFKTLRQCRAIGLGLGLDLKGGMSAILEVDVPEVIKTMSGHKELEHGYADFKEAVAKAAAETENEGNFIEAFDKAYEQPLAELFYDSEKMGDKVKKDDSDDKVKEVLAAEVADAAENMYNVIRQRIDNFGVANPNIQQLGGDRGQIMVELPGVKDIENVRKLLEGSANLEFWTCYNYGEDLDISALLAELDEVAAGSYSFEAEEVEEVPAVADSAATDTTATEMVAEAEEEDEVEEVLNLRPFSSLLSQANRGCIAFRAHVDDMATINAILAKPEAQDILRDHDVQLRWSVAGVEDPQTKKRTNYYDLYALKGVKAPMEGGVVDARDEFRDNKPAVTMSMSEDGARKWSDLTYESTNHCVAIVLDGRVYSAPMVHERIAGGNSEITGDFTIEETRELASVLKAGKMSAPAKIISSEVIGPSLGAESIQMGIYSCILAFIILMLYMVAMYGFKPGMVANCALLLNLFFTIGVLTSFQAALTLSGIAGLVLTLGMAVDANVLIYERTKEEMKSGKRCADALQAGYSNAFSAIFDSNLTSIITAIILFYFGKGPIRGFATTLGIGIVCSFFTSVFVTRVFYSTMQEKGKWLDLKFKTSIGNRLSFKEPSFKFMQNYKKSFIVFGAMAVICLGAIFGRGFSESIDFTGGRNYTVVTDQQLKANEVENLLKQTFDGSSVSVIAQGVEGKQMRISTNFEKDNSKADSLIKAKMFATLTEAGLVTAQYESFINPEPSEGGYIASSQEVGPSMAKDITRGALIAVALAFIAIFLYILLRFRNVAFSVGAITALGVDIIIILGMYALLWGIAPFSLDIDQTFIGAILTAIGYSINDKVVVFDRIRENLGLYPKRDRQQLFNESLNTTLNRTINTSVSTFIVLAVIFVIGLFFKGADSIISFSFAMILGVVFGTFSSMFVAAPVAYLVMGNKINEDAEEAK